ncbi:hypothetical protein [Borrelia turcica]|nr:hypothetical protein [Borrelia turcica]
MHLIKLMTAILSLLVVVPNSYSYNHLFQHRNDGVDKYNIELLNDSYGFSFSDFFDDLRSGSIVFTFESKYNFTLNIETHSFTYRGYKDDPIAVQTRTDIIELGALYFFPFTLIKDSSYFGHIDFGIGFKNLLYGNWGGALTQNTLHLLVRQTRPAPVAYEPYNYRGFISSAFLYSYGGLLLLENYLDFSYFADFFAKISFGVDLRNKDIGLVTKLFFQTQNKIDEIKAYAITQEAESGLGIQYKLYSKNFTSVNTIHIENFSSNNRFFSVGGFGVIFTKEYDTPQQHAIFALSNLFSFAYEWMIPFQIRSILYYSLTPQLKSYAAIATNYDINLPDKDSFTNRFSSGISFTLLSH